MDRDPGMRRFGKGNVVERRHQPLGRWPVRHRLNQELTHTTPYRFDKCIRQQARYRNDKRERQQLQLQRREEVREEVFEEGHLESLTLL